MGWNISHGTNCYGEFRRSDASMSNLGRQLSHVLPARDWRQIAHLFNRRSGDPFTVQPKDAARAASIIRAASQHRLMPADWAQAAAELADAGESAARSGQTWEWR